MFDYHDENKEYYLTDEQKACLVEFDKRGISYIDMISLYEWRNLEAMYNFDMLWDECNIFLQDVRWNRHRKEREEEEKLWTKQHQRSRWDVVGDWIHSIGDDTPQTPELPQDQATVEQSYLLSHDDFRNFVYGVDVGHSRTDLDEI